MMEFNVEGYKDVTWREYREYARLLQEIVPEDDRGMSVNEMTELMFYAAIFSGWVIGMDKPEDTENPEEFIAQAQEALGDERPGRVLALLDDFSEFYGKLRTPDPN